MKDWKHYLPSARPVWTNFKTRYWYKQGKCVFTQLPGGLPPKSSSLEGTVHEATYDHNLYAQALAQWNDDNAQKRKGFLQDLRHDLSIGCKGRQLSDAQWEGLLSCARTLIEEEDVDVDDWHRRTYQVAETLLRFWPLS